MGTITVDGNIIRTYDELLMTEEAKMHIAAHALRDIAELAALGAFLIMIALAARALGA
jgi:ATP-dependent protease HslVU (ClpYQ) ATPase subunit